MYRNNLKLIFTSFFLNCAFILQGMNHKQTVLHEFNNKPSTNRSFGVNVSVSSEYGRGRSARSFHNDTPYLQPAYLSNSSDIFAAQSEMELNCALKEMQSCINSKDFYTAKRIVLEYQNSFDRSMREQSTILNNFFERSLDTHAQKIVKQYDIKNVTPAIKDVIKTMAVSAHPRESMTIVSKALMENKTDSKCVQELEKLLDFNGLPRSYIYNKTLFYGTTFSKNITQSQLPDRLLLLDVALYQSQNSQAKEMQQRCVFYLEKALGDSPLAQSYSCLAHATFNALLDARNNDQTIVQCGDFLSKSTSIDYDVLHRRTVPLAANLVKEIARYKSENNMEKVAYYQSQLLQLNEHFQQCAYSPQSQEKLTDMIVRLNSELQTFSRPEMLRSPSLEKLYRLVATEFLVSTNLGSVSYTEFNGFSGTVEQNALHKEMVEDIRLVNAKAKVLSIKGEENSEAVKVYNKLVEAAYELNRDSQVTLARGVFAVAKDIASIIIFDTPVVEFANCASEALQHPLIYCSKDVEVVKNVLGEIGSLIKDMPLGSQVSGQDQLRYSKHCNELVHSFFDRWQSLSLQEKKEVVAHVSVDAVSLVGLSYIPKLMQLSEGLMSLGSIDSGLSGGGAVAIPIKESLKALVSRDDVALVNAGQGAAALVATGGFESLVDFRINRALYGAGLKAEGLPNYIENCIKLKTCVNQPIDKIIDAKTIIHKVPLTLENHIIKEFNVIKNHYKHTFSKKHMDNKLMEAGCNAVDIMEKFVNIALDLDKQGLLVENGVQIETAINNIDLTIRVHVTDGVVQSINGFSGFSNDIIGKLIQYSYKGL